MFLVMLAACARDESGSFSVTDVTAYAPLVGQASGVAYFLLENSTTAALTLERVTSPEFGAVQMHTTLLDQGISRMQPLDSLTVPALSIMEFGPGGRHLMLMEPRANVGAGDGVTLEFHYRHDGQGDKRLAVRTRLQSR